MTKLTFLCLLFVIITICTFQVNANFLTRALPTPIEYKETQIDGRYECDAACSADDIFSVVFSSPTKDLKKYFVPIKLNITWFLESTAISDAVLTHYEVPFNSNFEAKSPITKLGKWDKGTTIRFAGNIIYKTITTSAATEVQTPLLRFEYISAIGSTSLATSSLYFVDSFYPVTKSAAPKPTVQLVYDGISTKSYSFAATLPSIPRTASTIILRPFGALRNQHHRDNITDIECVVNSLEMHTKVNMDEMGDPYYIITFPKDVLAHKSNYVIAKNTDMSIHCYLEQDLDSKRPPYGMAVSINDASNKAQTANHYPTIFFGPNDLEFLNLTDDVFAEAKVMVPYDFFQSTYEPYVYHMRTQDQRMVYRSHYTYYYYFINTDMKPAFKNDNARFDLTVQNMLNGMHVSTSWSYYGIVSDDKGHPRMFLFDRGSIAPKTRDAKKSEPLTFPSFLPKVVQQKMQTKLPSFLY
eukprot:UN00433